MNKIKNLRKDKKGGRKMKNDIIEKIFLLLLYNGA